MRIILYTGKGGVGKTSVAAATALRCADLGYRTIVVSTDAAHSLGDSFDREIGSEPIELAPKLKAQEIDVLYQMQRHWGTIQQWVNSVLQWRGVNELVADEASVLPGMDELASLLQIVSLYESGDYDVIIVDCAPTGETLRLLSLPEVARWYLAHIFPIERTAMRVAGPILRGLTDLPVPDDAIFDTIKQLILQLDRMHQLLADPVLSSVRLVLNPEKMVIKEAQRTFTYINLYGYGCDLVIENRVMPEAAQEGYFRAFRETQAKYMQLVEEAFTPVPIVKGPYFEQEVVGATMLRRMGAAIYGDEDPAKVYYEGSPQVVEKRGDHYELILRLPFAAKGDVKLTRAGDELAISLGNFRRNLVLPRALALREVAGAKFEQATLTLTFAGQPDEHGR
ncbi:MAG: ArsA family ATPase [Chloroflexi bacterium]|nr:ArsA family ATPase [Chloroflexota bacterium]